MKVILMTSNFNLAANIAVRAFLENQNKLKKHNIEIVGLICASTVGLNFRSVKLSWRFLKKSGIKFFAKTIGVNVWQQAKLKFAKYFLTKNEREFFDFKELSRDFNITYFETGNINNIDVEDFIKKQQADCLVSCHLLQILKKNILEIPELGSINFHPSLLQKHRGSFTSFWALLKKWKTSGATVHYMTEKLDDGKVILQRKFFIKPDDSIFCVNKKNALIGAKLLIKALIKIKKKTVKAQHLQKLGKMFSMPTARQVERFEKKSGGFIRWRDFFKV